MVGDLFSAFVLTRTISELKIPGQRPFSAFVLTRTISEGPLPPGVVPPKVLVPRSWYQDPWYQDLGADGLIIFFCGASRVHQVFDPWVALGERSEWNPGD